MYILGYHGTFTAFPHSDCRVSLCFFVVPNKYLLRTFINKRVTHCCCCEHESCHYIRSCSLLLVFLFTALYTSTTLHLVFPHFSGKSYYVPSDRSRSSIVYKISVVWGPVQILYRASYTAFPFEMRATEPQTKWTRPVGSN